MSKFLIDLYKRIILYKKALLPNTKKKFSTQYLLLGHFIPQTLYETVDPQKSKGPRVHRGNRGILICRVASLDNYNMVVQRPRRCQRLGQHKEMIYVAFINEDLFDIF